MSPDDRPTTARPAGRAVRRFLLALAVGLGLSIAFAGPAGADPAKPTNYRSVVTSVRPATDAIRVKIVGGDGFFDIDVAQGHTVQVDGYVDEPYLRIQADGTVQENTNSPATYLNRTRSGTTGVPDALQQSTLPAPVWKTIGHGGHAVWHDHRIHFMGKDPSAVPGLAEGRAQPWTVKLLVDGRSTVVAGDYHYVSPPSIAVPAVVILVVLGALVVLGRRRPVTVAAAATAAAGLVGVVLGWEQNAAIPKGAGATPLTIALPALALVGGAIGLARRERPAGVIAVLAGVACLGGWVFSRITVLNRSVLPTELSFAVDRIGTAAIVGAAVAAAWLAVRSGALAVPRAPTAEAPDPTPTDAPTAPA